MNDRMRLALVALDGEEIDTVTWPDARERVGAYMGALSSEVRELAEDLLCAIFTGSADGSGWRPLRLGETGKAIEDIPAGAPLEINDCGDIRAAR